MSKIQIKELSSTTSEFTTLNSQETSEVIGGYSYYYSYPGFSFSFSNYFSSKIATVEQVNLNENNQIALGSGAYYIVGKASTGKNGSSHTNNVTVYQS